MTVGIVPTVILFISSISRLNPIWLKRPVSIGSIWVSDAIQRAETIPKIPILIISKRLSPKYLPTIPIITSTIPNTKTIRQNMNS